MVYLRITMHQAIGNHQPLGFMYGIVAGGLVESRLTDFYRRGFAFDYHNPVPMVVKDHDICSFLKLIELQSPFNLDQCSRKLLFKDQVLDKMLPYPFFGSEDQVFFAKLVKDKVLGIF